MITFGRFGIRAFDAWDGPALFKITSDPETMRYMGMRTHTRMRQAEDLLATYRASHQAFNAICTADNPRNVIGLFGMETTRHAVMVLIMFRRSKDARGAGREFSKPLVRWLFTHRSVWRVAAFCHVDNIAVQRVLARMGACQEGRLRRFEMFPNISDEPQDCFMYSITR